MILGVGNLGKNYLGDSQLFQAMSAGFVWLLVVSYKIVCRLAGPRDPIHKFASWLGL